jgi:hypothetical protein
MAGQYNQDKSMAGRYGAGDYIRGTVVSFYQSATTPGGDHISIPIEKKHHPMRSEEEQTVKMICRPNSKGTPFIDVYLIWVLCSLFFAPLCTGFNFLCV